MAEHPIQGLMRTAMDSIKQMVDVNTVVGTPVEAHDGSVIIPISRVTFGFAAGGGDFEDQRPRRSVGHWSRRRGPGSEGDQEGDSGGERGSPLPFAGGSGAGVSVNPVGFLVVTDGDVRLISVEGMPVLERLVDMAPVLLDQVTALLQLDGDGGGGGGGANGDSARGGGGQDAGQRDGKGGGGQGGDQGGQAGGSNGSGNGRPGARRFRLGGQIRQNEN